MIEHVLDISDLSVRYSSEHADVLAVTGFSLAISAGEIVGLVGESGCGKSSVAMAIMRYLGRNGRISDGTIHFRGADMAALPADALRRLRGRHIAMVYQDPATALNPTKRVGDQLTEVLRHHTGAKQSAALERVLAMLSAVRLPDPTMVLQRYPHQLSGGQQQRVVIAMAFLTNPELLLLDEPTTALDVTVEREIVDLVAEMRKAHGTAVLFISHNLGLVRRACERVAVMYGGQIVEEGPVDRIFAAPRHPYTRSLLACLPLLDTDKRTRPLNAIRGRMAQLTAAPTTCSFLSRCDNGQKGTCDAANPELELSEAGPAHRVRCFRWKAIADQRMDQPTPQGRQPTHLVPAPILVVTGLTKRYQLPGGLFVCANRNLSFTLSAGETLGVVGESGSGKTTLGRIVIGMEVATHGEVFLRGTDVGQVPTQRRNRALVRAVQMVFQNPDSTLNPAWTAGGILNRALVILGNHATRKERNAALLRLLRLVQLPAEIVDMNPARLSGGEKQRVAIARAFAGRPEIVVADEPTSALDTSVKTAIIELLLQAQQEHQTALLFISHDLGVVRYIADRVIVMHAGEIVEIGSTEAVFAPPYHPYTESLLSAVPIADAGLMQRRVPIAGEMPSLIGDPDGCAFAARCQRKLSDGLCDRVAPQLVEAGNGHAIRCHISMEELRQVPPVFHRIFPG